MRRPKLPQRITAEWLARHGACEFEVSLFRYTFPKGATLTAANVRRAVGVGLNLRWFAWRFMTVTAYDRWIRQDCLLGRDIADYRRETAYIKALKGRIP